MVSCAVTSADANFNLIGFNFTTPGATTPDPQNWNRLSVSGGSTINNVIDETGAATGVNVTWGGVPQGPLYLSTSTLAPNATPQYDYDLSGMVGYGFRAGSELFATLSGLEANTPYEVWFVAYRGGGAIDNLVSVSDGDTIDAFSFAQQLPFDDNDGRFIVNSTVANSSQNWNDLSIVVNSSSTGTLTINWEGQTQTTVAGALAIRVIPAPGVGGVLVCSLLLAARRRR
ncbi:MAG: hypothetical protein EA378_07360 [Phycisphaerales bacterium]|nr:MAG: hypothetical protein EA378_07360 [Phycisphaerales bacterium]